MGFLSNYTDKELKWRSEHRDVSRAHSVVQNAMPLGDCYEVSFEIVTNEAAPFQTPRQTEVVTKRGEDEKKVA